MTPRAEDEALVPARVPAPALWAWRIAFTLLLAGYFAVVFQAVLAMQGTFGWSTGAFVRALLATAVMAVFVLPLVPFAEMPENWVLRMVPAQRRRRGLCPGCGYRAPRGTRCPECGSDGRVRPLLDPSWSALRTFLGMAAVGLLLGTAAGATLARLDEWSFRAEVEARHRAEPGAVVTRRRAWPGAFATLRWSPERGYEVDAPAGGRVLR